MAELESASQQNLWTLYKGGCFERQDKSNTWIQFDKDGNEIASFEELNGDDFDLQSYEMILLNRQKKSLIKLDKTHVRESLLDEKEEIAQPFDTLDYVLPKNWQVLDQGFWDTKLPKSDEKQ